MQLKKLLPITLTYDFDEILAERNCAEHDLLPELEIDEAGTFWADVKDQATSLDPAEILTYLGSLVKLASSK